MKRKEQVADLARKVEQVASLETRLAQMTVAREQAEAVIDRQGQRLTGLQEQAAGQLEQIEKLAAERDELKVQLPSSEDHEALAAMVALLTTKKAPAAQ